MILNYLLTQSVFIFLLVFENSNAVCPNNCNYQGECSEFDTCSCVRTLNGDALFTGADCSLRTCPKGKSWVSPEAVKVNDIHAILECSNRGLCDRSTGRCICMTGYEGFACERTSCNNDCSGNGICMSESDLAENAGIVYSVPWDAETQYGCLCDIGYRGYDCSQVECPSGPDILRGGLGNEMGRDCSGRGLCDYARGVCNCFYNFYGTSCQFQQAIS